MTVYTSRLVGYLPAVGGALFLAGCLFLGRPAAAQQGFLTGIYFTVPGNHPDFNRGTQDTANVTGLVENFLGPNGLPVRSNKGKNYPGPTPPLGTSGPITDVNAQNEILWWSGNSSITNHAVFEKTQIDALPFAFNNLVPDGQTSDIPLLLAVHFRGTFNISSGQVASFTNDVDDDLYGYIDSNLFIDEGGVVHRPPATINVSGLSTGPHTLDLFYVDREKGGASLNFSTNMTFSATVSPEPNAGFLFFAALPLLFCRRKRGWMHQS